MVLASSAGHQKHVWLASARYKSYWNADCSNFYHSGSKIYKLQFLTGEFRFYCNIPEYWLFSIIELDPNDPVSVIRFLNV